MKTPFLAEAHPNPMSFNTHHPPPKKKKRRNEKEKHAPRPAPASSLPLSLSLGTFSRPSDSGPGRPERSPPWAAALAAPCAARTPHESRAAEGRRAAAFGAGRKALGLRERHAIGSERRCGTLWKQKLGELRSDPPHYQPLVRTMYHIGLQVGEASVPLMRQLAEAVLGTPTGQKESVGARQKKKAGLRLQDGILNILAIWLWVKNGYPKWVALVNVTKDQSLQPPDSLILTHTQMAIWVWVKMKRSEAQTAGSDPRFHLPIGQPILAPFPDFHFEPRPDFSPARFGRPWAAGLHALEGGGYDLLVGSCLCHKKPRGQEAKKPKAGKKQRLKNNTPPKQPKKQNSPKKKWPLRQRKKKSAAAGGPGRKKDVTAPC